MQEEDDASSHYQPVAVQEEDDARVDVVVVRTSRVPSFEEKQKSCW